MTAALSVDFTGSTPTFAPSTSGSLIANTIRTPSRLERAGSPVYAGGFTYSSEQEALGERGTQSAFERLLAHLLRRVPLVAETAEPLIHELRHQSPGRMLDIGCGDGGLLGKMKAYGWDVCGVEPDRVATERACERWDVAVHSGNLEDVDLPAHSHDIVVCRYVIEHV